MGVEKPPNSHLEVFYYVSVVFFNRVNLIPRKNCLSKE